MISLWRQILRYYILWISQKEMPEGYVITVYVKLNRIFQNYANLPVNATCGKLLNVKDYDILCLEAVCNKYIYSYVPNVNSQAIFG